MELEHYFIYGNQELELKEKRKEALNTIQKQESFEDGLFSIDLIDFNHMDYFRKESLLEELRNTCEAISFLSPLNVIDIQNLQLLKTSKSKSNSELPSLILDYISNPPSNIIFLFTANIKKTSELDTKLYKEIKKNFKEIKTLITYDDFKPIDWLIQRARKLKLNIQKDVAELLIELVGNELTSLAKELEKISIQYADNYQLQKTDVVEHTAFRSQFNAFQVIESIVKRDLETTIERLNQILHQDSYQTLSIAAVITAHFRKLIRIRYLMDNNETESGIIKQLKLHPWLGKQWVQQTQRFTIQELENLMIELCQFDIRMKYAGNQARYLLEDIIQNLILKKYQKKSFLKVHWLEEEY